MITDEIVRGEVPGWMLRAGREHWNAIMRATLGVVDATVGRVVSGRAASMPGQVATNDGTHGDFPNIDALPLIGRDRRLIRGKHETVDEYAARLRYWRQAWKKAGTPEGLLSAVRAVLMPAPTRIRLVHTDKSGSSGHWWTLDETGLRYQNSTRKGVFWPADGSAAVQDGTEAALWDWDSASWGSSFDPEPNRVWIIVYADKAAAKMDLTDDDGVFDTGGSVYGEKELSTADKYTIGTTATLPYVEAARVAASQFKPAGIRVSHIIVTFDSDAFLPDGTGTVYPDGTWKHHGKIATLLGSHVRVRARSPLARYWLGTV